jgi:hypothetical protein
VGQPDRHADIGIRAAKLLMAFYLGGDDAVARSKEFVQADRFVEFIAQIGHERHSRFPECARNGAGVGELQQEWSESVPLGARLADEVVLLHGGQEPMDGRGRQSRRPGKLADAQLRSAPVEAAQDGHSAVDGLHAVSSLL